MSRLLSWCALLLIVSNVTGYYLLVLVQLHTHINNRELRFSTPNHTVSFAFSVEVFKNIRLDDHEIRVDNKLYDIISIQRKGQQVYLIATADTFEDELLSLLQAIADADPLEETLADLLEYPDSCHNYDIWTASIQGYVIKHHTEHLLAPHEIYAAVAVPPPWLA